MGIYKNYIYDLSKILYNDARMRYKLKHVWESVLMSVIDDGDVANINKIMCIVMKYYDNINEIRVYDKKIYSKGIEMLKDKLENIANHVMIYYNKNR